MGRGRGKGGLVAGGAASVKAQKHSDDSGICRSHDRTWERTGRRCMFAAKITDEHVGRDQCCHLHCAMEVVPILMMQPRHRPDRI